MVDWRLRDRVPVRLEYHDGRMVEGTLPFNRKSWSIVRYDGRSFVGGYEWDDHYVFYESTQQTEDFAPTPSPSGDGNG